MLTDSPAFDHSNKSEKAKKRSRLVFENQHASQNMLEKLATLQKTNTFCDVTIKVEQRIFPAHKCILAACSDYLLREFLDNNENVGDLCISLEDATVGSFEKLFQYFYSAKLDVALEEVPDVFSLAKKLRVDAVSKVCSEFLSSHLTLSNIADIRECVGEAEELELCNAADSFIRENADLIVASPEVIKHSINIDIMVDALPETEFRENLAELVICWLNNTLLNSQVPMEELNDTNILLYLTPGNAIIDCRELDKTSLSNIAVVKDYILAAQSGKQSRTGLPLRGRPAGLLSKNTTVNSPTSSYNGGLNNATSFVSSSNGTALNSSNPKCEHRESVHANGTRESSQPGKETCLIAITNLEDNHDIACVTKVYGRLTRLSIHTRLLSDLQQVGQTLPPGGVSPSTNNVPTLGVGQIVTGVHNPDISSTGSEAGSVYSVASQPHSDNVEDNEISDLNLCINSFGSQNVGMSPLMMRANSLESLAVMSQPRCAAGLVLIKNSVVVLGGFNRGECMNTVEEYSLEKNCWTPLVNMNNPRSRCSAVTVNDCIYAIGGSNGSRDMASVERFDWNSKTWSSVANMLQPRSDHGAAVVNGRIYVLGGKNDSYSMKTVEMYDPETNVWVSKPSLPSSCSEAAVCSYQENIYVVGGLHNWECLKTVFVFNTVTEQWTSLPNLHQGRRGAALIPYQDKLYLLGGSDGTSVLSTMEILDLQASNGFAPVGSITSSQWRPGPTLNLPRVNLCAALLQRDIVGGDRLVALGGFSGKHFLDSVEQLDLSNEENRSHEWCMFMPNIIRSQRRESSSNDSA